jgi:hypothetical protein
MHSKYRNLGFATGTNESDGSGQMTGYPEVNCEVPEKSGLRNLLEPGVNPVSTIDVRRQFLSSPR